MKNKVKCYICGTEYKGGDSLVDNCPYCDWTYLGWENELDIDDKNSSNPVTVRQAKKRVSEGKNIWGDPLPQSEIMRNERE